MPVWPIDSPSNCAARLPSTQAVEQGRGEERRRLAQDLHDDIGARLLTLMYKAQSPEMEDYARHTLQDLKTLTRGLAASNQLLSHALAEWKADITQRLGSARIELKWSAEQDTDVVLSMVQWSGLTRVLRELVSNVMAHADARCVEIAFRLSADRLEIRLQDDGSGQAPQNWAPGLGLGGGAQARAPVGRRGVLAGSRTARHRLPGRHRALVVQPLNVLSRPPPHNAAMNSESQIVVPPSFVALFVPPGRTKPNASREAITARYEHCEDLATLLTDTASTLLWQLGVTQQDILVRVHRGLLAGEATVAPPEAGWVVERLAELLGWERPDLAAEAGLDAS